MNHVHIHVIPKPSLEQGMIFKMEDYAHKVERPKEELLMVRAPCLIPNTSLTASRIADAGKDEGSSRQIVNLRCKIFHQSTPIHPDPKNLNTERVIRCEIINSTQNNMLGRENGKIYIMTTANTSGTVNYLKSTHLWSRKHAVIDIRRWSCSDGRLSRM